MGQIKAGAIEKGTFLLVKNTPYIVVEREFVSPGKGSAFSRLKMKSLTNGLVLKETYKTQDMVEEIEVYDENSQYLYRDDENYHFMNTDNYEQYEVPITGLEDKGYFLMEGDTYKVVRWEAKTLDIKLPPKMDLVVAEAEEAVKGDTVTGATKYVTVETGLQVKVPIFIKKGEKIRINTETKEYQERVNS